jgi:WD repeat-containing protein 61
MIEVTKIAHLSGHKDSIYALTFNKENASIYSGAADGMVVRWNAYQQEDGLLVMKCPTPVYSLYTNTQNTIIAGTREGNLHIGDLNQNKELKWIEAHKGGVFDILPYKQGVITLSEDGTIACWDEHFTLEFRLKVASKRLRIGRFINEHHLLIGSSDHLIYLVDLATKRIIQVFESHTNSVFALATHSDFFYSGGRDAQLIKWEIETGKYEKLPAHLYHINALDIHPTLPLMLSCSMDKTIKLWDLEKFKLMKVIDNERHQSHINCVNKVLWIDTNHFISCSDDRTILVFELTNLI